MRHGEAEGVRRREAEGVRHSEAEEVGHSEAEEVRHSEAEEVRHGEAEGVRHRQEARKELNHWEEEVRGGETQAGNAGVEGRVSCRRRGMEGRVLQEAKNGGACDVWRSM